MSVESVGLLINRICPVRGSNYEKLSLTEIGPGKLLIKRYVRIKPYSNYQDSTCISVPSQKSAWVDKGMLKGMNV